MTNELAKPAAEGSLEAGILLGHTQAFAMIAGRCSAAQAVAIRHLREDRLYKSVTEKWEDFCASHLKMSKRNADQIIALLDEFGPKYFEIAQLTRISAATYRAIQPHIKDGALHHEGEAIALIEANSKKIAAAVGEIRRKKAPASDLAHRFVKISERSKALVADYKRLAAEDRNREHRQRILGMLRWLSLELDVLQMGL